MLLKERCSYTNTEKKATWKNSQCYIPFLAPDLSNLKSASSQVSHMALPCWQGEFRHAGACPEIHNGGGGGEGENYLFFAFSGGGGERAPKITAKMKWQIKNVVKYR